ncbi:CaiC Acyl-CoA synthetase AMP-forming AMP-acid ligase II [Pyrenophora tritici-repentis]|uniref:4-coumarate-CoA ligase n=2 Tax=Pyrenophora tritici-repentis TaxID=45151 RepID=A0A2W1GY34_9PLEO|nr:4-coumarate-CoA ligase 2 [Pyrenophora tritici-repentis Pt-1C-BFP]KAA8626702.1 4-coumarate-CoA ligase 2 [Pyrenophora tritici-repentis]EDU41434.1 4-coumarate-CoA ligase 2 [Pyrenophora tritici-repentis Pt-1C-BFP]KAF7455135.1 4-coumarate-CoA ligase 2 [Pyrenophora tritici-repentis]KAF7578299.1 CaiC, Acyl-CoA synthetase (AMP-forming)-AMP-acid ligase II [Pyrenophora tritici-repentis]KAG9388890.1 4-coumarate-CoA ligase 2 [Pyrenophora tritici-repentis]
MVIFKSRQPPIDLPTDLTDWDWLFDSLYSPINRNPANELAGFQNALTKERVDWADVKKYSTFISTALVKKYGLKEGETVALFSQNTVWYPVAMFAGLRAGAKISGASPAYNVEEMTFALKTADAKFLMTTPGSMEIAAASAKAAGLPQSNVFLLEGELPGYTTVQDLIRMGESYGEPGQSPAFKLPPGKTNKDVCAFLSFSSGTTGLPKAVMISHQNVIAQCLQVQQITPKTLKKVMAVLPLFHITGLIHQMHLPILLNAEVVMLPQFSMEKMLNAVVEYKLTELLLVPPIIIRLVRDPLVDKYDLSHIERFSSGAAPLSEEILQQLQKKFPHTGFKQGYGMTESSSCITAHPPEKYSYKYAHSGGAIVASTEVKIIKDDGTEGDVGEDGEVLARGPQVVMGYLNNEKATSETFDAEGFLHTGDRGSIDEDNMIHITDRIKELIKVKGIGVAPAELEDLLLGHPKVEDVAVMSVKDDYSGELPKAYVVVKPGLQESTSLGKEIIAYVKEKKVRYKWVKEVEFINEIPKSPSGKILRRILRDKEKSGKFGLVVKDEVKAKL